MKLKDVKKNFNTAGLKHTFLKRDPLETRQSSLKKSVRRENDVGGALPP